MNQLETGILATLWHHILHRFHANSQALQSADQDLNSAVAIYESLVDFIGKQRARFEEFEAEGKSSVNVTSTSAKRNECVSEITATTSQERRNCRRPLPISSIRIRSLSCIIDRIDAELRKRLGRIHRNCCKVWFSTKAQGPFS